MRASAPTVTRTLSTGFLAVSEPFSVSRIVSPANLPVRAKDSVEKRQQGNSRDSSRRWTRGCYVTATLQRPAYPPASGASADESGWLLRRRQRSEPLAPRLVVSSRVASRRIASRRIASRRDARVWVNRERRRTRRTVSPPPRASLIHSVHFASVDVPPSIPSRTLLPPPLSRPRRLPRSRIARRGRDRGHGGEKERGRRKAGRRGRASASEANKEEQASEETRTGGAEEEVEVVEVEEEGGKRTTTTTTPGVPPTTRPAAATPVRSQSALDRRPLDFAIHERR